MVGEAGWEVPFSYRGAIDEAAEVRRSAGVFDLSHFGRIRIRGEGSLALLERACTTDAVRQEDDTAAATLLCNESGGIIDLCRLVRLEDSWLLVTSPLCRVKVLEHLSGLAEKFGAKVDDRTLKTVQLAVCGPAAAKRLDAVLPERVSDMPEGAVKSGSFLIAKYAAIRAGLGGVWGLEVVIPDMLAGKAWDFITAKAGASAVAPAGMGAMDILRIEAGMPRYGCELNETIDPITAGLETLVDVNHDFMGRSAIERVSARGTSRRRVGLVIEAQEGARQGGTIARQGTPVLRADGTECGSITSATFSPTLGKVVAMAYLPGDAAVAGTGLLVAAEAGGPRRGGRNAVAAELPFVR